MKIKTPEALIAHIAKKRWGTTDPTLIKLYMRIERLENANLILLESFQNLVADLKPLCK